MRGDLGRFAKGLKGKLRLWSNTAALSGRLPGDLGGSWRVTPISMWSLKSVRAPPSPRAARRRHSSWGAVASGGARRPGMPAYGEDRLVALLPSGHPLAGRDDLTFAELAREDFVGLAAGIALKRHGRPTRRRASGSP